MQGIQLRKKLNHWYFKSTLLWCLGQMLRNFLRNAEKTLRKGTTYWVLKKSKRRKFQFQNGYWDNENICGFPICPFTQWVEIIPKLFPYLLCVFAIFLFNFSKHCILRPHLFWKIFANFLTSALLYAQNTLLLSTVRQRFFQILWPSQALS